MFRGERTWRTSLLFFLLVLSLIPFIPSANASDISAYFYERPTFVDVSVGKSSACAVSKDNEVWCWGANSNFQVAQRNSKFEATPWKVMGITDATSVSVGASHSCALLKNKRVVCWGSNKLGQLGTGFSPSELTNSPIPQYVNGVTDVVRIESGEDNTCAITERKLVFCWGSNSRGQLGQDFNDNPRGLGRTYIPQAEPIEIQDVKDIGLGLAHTCVLTSKGFVYCLGDNLYGQLGTSWSVRNSLKPLLVGTLTNITEIDTYSNSNCAISTAGLLRCWGSGDSGKLGTGEAIDLIVPTVGLIGLGKEKITNFAVGFRSTCALISNLGISCWGSSTFGQAGSITPFSSFVGLAQNAIKIDSGEDYSCALTTNIFCWGKNDVGQLGRISTSSSGGYSQINEPRWDLGKSSITHSVKENVVTITWPAIGASQTYARVESAPGKLLCQTNTLYSCDFIAETLGTLNLTLYLFVNDINGKNQGMKADYSLQVQSITSEAEKKLIDDESKRAEDLGEIAKKEAMAKKLQELSEKLKLAEAQLLIAEQKSIRLNDLFAEKLDSLAAAKDRESAAADILTAAIKLQSENLLLLKKITKQLTQFN